MIIKCPECGKDVSNKADKCIHCGYPFKAETVVTKEEKAQMVGLRVFLGIITLLLSFVFNNYTTVKFLNEGVDAIESGAFSSLLMTLSGIIMLCMCKTKNYKVLLIPIVIILICFLACSYTTIYTVLSMLFALAWMIPAYEQKKNSK